MRVLRRILAAALLLIVAAGAVVVWKIGPSNIVGMLRYDRRREGSLKVGDVAPDVALAKLDGNGEIRLAELARGKPLVLIFGSFT